MLSLVLRCWQLHSLLSLDLFWPSKTLPTLSYLLATGNLTSCLRSNLGHHLGPTVQLDLAKPFIQPFARVQELWMSGKALCNRHKQGSHWEPQLGESKSGGGVVLGSSLWQWHLEGTGERRYKDDQTSREAAGVAYKDLDWVGAGERLDKRKIWKGVSIGFETWWVSLGREEEAREEASVSSRYIQTYYQEQHMRIHWNNFCLFGF